MTRCLLIFSFLIQANIVCAQISTPSRIGVQDEGTPQGTVRVLNCVGSSVACTVSGTTGTVTVSAGGSGNTLEVSINFDTLNRTNASVERATALVTSWYRGTTGITNLQNCVWATTIKRFACVAQTGTSPVMISNDGLLWSAQAVPEANTWKDVTWAPSLTLFAAVSGNGTNRVMTSPDGISWTARSAAAVANWETLAWSPSLSIFVGLGLAGVAMSSPDGITWTTRTSADTSNWLDVEWGASIGRFCAVEAVGGAFQAMYSTNGTTWTGATLPSALAWPTISWSEELGLFVAFASDGSIASSPDCSSWTARTNPSAAIPGSVAWSKELGLFVAPSGSTLLTSFNGTTWTANVLPGIPAGEPGAVAIVWGTDVGSFVIVPTTGAITYLSEQWLPALGFVFTATVTGQSWVTSNSKIVCAPFGLTTDGQTVETVTAAGFDVSTSNLVASTGFNLNISSPAGASGIFRFHCFGS